MKFWKDVALANSAAIGVVQRAKKHSLMWLIKYKQDSNEASKASRKGPFWLETEDYGFCSGWLRAPEKQKNSYLCIYTFYTVHCGIHSPLAPFIIDLNKAKEYPAIDIYTEGVSKAWY